MTKFMINNKTDALKTDINLFFTITNCLQTADCRLQLYFWKCMLTSIRNVKVIKWKFLICLSPLFVLYFWGCQYVWVIDQVWGQYGWILAKFFYCVFMDRDEVEVHKLAKKERSQYPAILTEQTWSIKDLLYGFWWNCPCGIQRVVPSGQDGSTDLARSRS